ncbi:hypothetical protein GOP47_0026656 [Adiantum capillus-veneris]|nr:hypothetical protein GOP47_0026656 [Adiantum capillus-veneris]
MQDIGVAILDEVGAAAKRQEALDKGGGGGDGGASGCPAPRMAVSHPADIVLHGRLPRGEHRRPGRPVNCGGLRGRGGCRPLQARPAVGALVRAALARPAPALLPPFHICHDHEQPAPRPTARRRPLPLPRLVPPSRPQHQALAPHRVLHARPPRLLLPPPLGPSSSIRRLLPKPPFTNRVWMLQTSQFLQLLIC